MNFSDILNIPFADNPDMTYLRPSYPFVAESILARFSATRRHIKPRTLKDMHDGRSLTEDGRQILSVAKDRGAALCTALIETECGDPTARSIVTALNGLFGPPRLIGRYGDTTLAALLDTTEIVPDPKTAHKIFDELRNEIRSKLPGADHPSRFPPIGIGAVIGVPATLEGMLSKADELLRFAVDAGADCTATAPIREPARRLTRPRRHGFG